MQTTQRIFQVSATRLSHSTRTCHIAISSRHVSMKRPTTFTTSSFIFSPTRAPLSSDTRRQPQSRYMAFSNVPTGTSWSRIQTFFTEQGFPNVKVDFEADNFARLKFEHPESVDKAFARLNGFSFHGVAMKLHKGRSFRVEDGTTTVGSLTLPADAPQFRWQDIKDQLTPFTPVLSVDQLKSNVFRVRFFTQQDFRAASEHFNNSGLELTDGTRLRVLLRPWLDLRNKNTGANGPTPKYSRQTNPRPASQMPPRDTNSV